MFLKPDTPAILLAPMEGVTDAPMRELLTRTGFYDFCVSEFIRVSANVLNAKVFKKHIPELLTGGKTTSNIPVQVQILGGDPGRIAESALHAIEAGATGIDLNFGCPAPTVNRHDGGATLLKFPERIEAIVRTLRDAVPAHLPVSAKFRLGFDDPTTIYENSRRAEQGGASWIAIHGRTKMQGYTPPAYWKPIGEVRQALSIPVVANGEIWTIEDFRRCREETGAIHYMIGRGALAMPNLAREMRKELGLSVIATPNPYVFPEGVEAAEWAEVFEVFSKLQPSDKRLKQWTRYLASKREVTWWNDVKALGSTEEILIHLKRFQAAKPSASIESEHPARTEL